PGSHPSPGELKLWDVAARKEVATLKEHEVTVMSVAFDRDGKRLASGDMNGFLILWDVKMGEKPQRGNPPPAGGGDIGAIPDNGPPSNRTRSPDLEGRIAKITAATEAEKKQGILAIVTLDGDKTSVQITRETELQISAGKLVEEASVKSLEN